MVIFLTADVDVSVGYLAALLCSGGRGLVYSESGEVGGEAGAGRPLLPPHVFQQVGVGRPLEHSRGQRPPSLGTNTSKVVQYRNSNVLEVSRKDGIKYKNARPFMQFCSIPRTYLWITLTASCML